jgi:hypothetical protein
MDTAARPIFTLFASRYLRLRHASFWHQAKDLGSATTTSAILGYNRPAERIDAIPALDPQRTSATLAHRDAAIRCGVPRELVVSWHLLFLQGGSNEAAKVLNFDQWLGDRLAVVSYCAAVPPSLIARADEVIE